MERKPLFKNVRIIVNPASGQDDLLLSVVNRIFRPLGIQWRVYITQGEGDGRDLARKALRKGTDLVIVHGGDGTIMEVANGLLGHEVPMAVLQGGTGNAIAAEFGVSARLEDALRAIALGLGHVRPMDVGQVVFDAQQDPCHFLLRADTGLSTEVMRETSAEMKSRFGILAYAVTLAQKLTQSPDITFMLDIDGEAVHARGAACVIANIGSVGALDMRIGPSVQPDDGLLDVFVLNTQAPTLLSVAASALQLADLTDVFDHWQARAVAVRTDHPLPMGLDGDPYAETPFRASVLPGALPVFVPHSAI
ncbi:MAG: diacylglycerol/lipid kinase family protein [Anaerolineales bacterium]